MSKKTVLILENENGPRFDLHGALQDRGFLVVSAPDLEAARHLVVELGDSLDVLVLDMLLEGEMTGAQFGLEVKRQLGDRHPEFLIVSGFGEEVYYQQSLQLQAAAYLRKPASLDRIARHVRVLALRRALRPLHPQLTDAIEEIAETSRSKQEAVLRFCRNILVPELRATLGSSFVLLVLQEDDVEPIAVGTPGAYSGGVYRVLQRQIEIAAGPFLVKPDRVPNYEGMDPETHQEARKLFRELDGSAFLSLYTAEGMRISLGVVQGDRSDPFTEDALKLVRLLAEHLQPALVNPVVKLIERFTAIFSKQRAMLEATSDFCLHVGQEQLAILERFMERIEERAGESNEAVEAYSRLIQESDEVERLVALGENLRQAGELLSCLTLPAEPSAQERRGPSSMRRLIQEAWLSVQGERYGVGEDFLELEDDCQVAAKPDDLQAAVARILRWFTRRIIETAPGEKPVLRVTCKPLAAAAPGPENLIVFEDRSKRLPKAIRENLFTPFSDVYLEAASSPATGSGILGLYLSKVLVVENGGSLRDRSDDLPGTVGHRFVLCLPANRKAA